MDSLRIVIAYILGDLRCPCSKYDYGGFGFEFQKDTQKLIEECLIYRISTKLGKTAKLYIHLVIDIEIQNNQIGIGRYVVCLL